MALLDFLYADHERVASLLAQLTGFGTQKSYERTSSKGKSDTVNAGVDLKVIKAGGESGREWNKEIREAYDPLWANSQRLIARVSQSNDDNPFKNLEIGQLRILRGTLLCYDHSLITALLSAESIEEVIAGGVNDSDLPSTRNKTLHNRNKKNLANVIRDFLKSLPLGVGFVLVSDEGHFWFNVKRDFLSLQDLDIPMKFITHVSGIWSVLGVVDAAAHDHIAGVQSVIDRNIDGLLPPMALNFLQLSGTITVQFGRPLTAGGLSPLVVYREIATNLLEGGAE